MNPSYAVPAQYFYALASALPTDVTADVRYRLACLGDEKTVLDQLRKAKDDGTITEDAVVTFEMAARRLRGLGAVSGAQPVCASGVGHDLVAAYATYQTPAPVPADPVADIAPFWAGVMGDPALAASHLELALAAVTLETDPRPLIHHIKDAPAAGEGWQLDSVKNLDPTPWPAPAAPALDFGDWRKLFTDFPADLPAITAPGPLDERIATFVRRLRKFFDVAAAGSGPDVPVAGAPATLDLPDFEPLQTFLSAYQAEPGQAGFAWGDPLDDAAVADALTSVPMDTDGLAWLEQVVRTVNTLATLTDLTTVPALTSSMRFSLMESLYARGFTSAEQVQRLSEDDFTTALTGTPAYENGYAHLIYEQAGGTGGWTSPGSGSFQPVNPGGLVNCIPQPQLSPLGPVAYLHELLRTPTDATCADPGTDAGDSTRLIDLVEPRRGPVSGLSVTPANADTPLPVVDLVNETLEAMVAGGADARASFDTAIDNVGDHQLRGLDDPDDPDATPYRHDPAVLFGVVAEHSSPATPGSSTAAYTTLATDFSAPALPYSQPLDANRSYLAALGTTRYDVMRAFRTDITEFVLDPEPPNEPAGFPRHLWRYPVRIPIAREYLGVTPEEYDQLFTVLPSGSFLASLYGYNDDGTNWEDVVVVLGTLLERTGLSYCELRDLWQSGIVPFRLVDEAALAKVRRYVDVATKSAKRKQRQQVGTVEGEHLQPIDEGEWTPGEFAECEPCCLDEIVVFQGDRTAALARLAVVVRLWRKLQALPNAHYTFTQLADICAVLGLFTAGGVNPDFVRQLASFQLLRDDFGLPLTDPTSAAAGTGADRTQLLALWSPGAAAWPWAVDQLIAAIERRARREHKRPPRSPEFLKLLVDNLDPLSLVAGFDPGIPARTWHARPTHTLRFGEQLTKLYASQFTVGEVLYLLTADDHLPGDDPFPLGDSGEALENPLDDPDDDEGFSLWRLRRELLDVDVDDAGDWTWSRVTAALGEVSPATQTATALTALAGHLFPGVVAAAGTGVDATAQRYAVPLAGSSEAMWNTPDSPFHYDGSAGELQASIPIVDEAVLTKLSRIRPLSAAESEAVRDLYFAPRVEIAQLSFLFPDPAAADWRLVQEPDEQRRWDYLRRQVALFHARCAVVDRFVAAHVEATTSTSRHGTEAVARELLLRLLADENTAAPAPWERDDGTRPDVTWAPPAGNAYAAIIGLVGTGLVGEYTVDESSTPLWRDVWAPTRAFGETRDGWNVPVPTVVPRLDFDLSAEQKRWAGVRNGVGIAASNAERLGGLEGYAVTWRGVLLVDQGGTYHFSAGAARHAGHTPKDDALPGHQWRVSLRRGQKDWVVLTQEWPDETDSEDVVALPLRRGAYEITVELVRCPPADDDLEDLRALHTGFEVAYRGPDTGDETVPIPREHLYLEDKDAALSVGLAETLKGNALASLRTRYVSTLRDVRRTYQRAFKALLLCHRFALSAEPFADYAQSELGYLLDHPDKFAGLAYYGSWTTHLVGFDPNLLPLLDVYFPPIGTDDRAAPTVQRRQALFDQWERLFDYTTLRAHAAVSPEHPVWLLFDEAAENQPDNAAQLLRHLAVDLTHADLVTHFWPGHDISADDLTDERWTTRVWQADHLLRRIVGRFAFVDVRVAQPAAWAGDDPGSPGAGNENLVLVVQDGCIERGVPRRYADLGALDDGLRQRARAALLAYLCGMNRVPLVDGSGYVTAPKQLSEVLLLDVEAGGCERASRIQDAITAVQTFVSRARLGLEPSWTPAADFVAYWDSKLATFRTWQACVRRGLYLENWVEWDEVEKARRTEAFRFLEDQLRRSTLTMPVPGGLEYWPADALPPHPALELLQAREPSAMRQLEGPREGLPLEGTPERSAQRSWLAPAREQQSQGTVVPGPIDDSPRTNDAVEQPRVAIRSYEVAPRGALSGHRFPLWLEAAIRLGTRFVRIPAAGIPSAATTFTPREEPDANACCVTCGCTHPPVIDEYYFWLVDCRWYDVVEQDPDWPGWHDDTQLPTLLNWPDKLMAHLAWCRVHNGEILAPHRSVEGIELADGTQPGSSELTFTGRTADSLWFTVANGVAPPGYDATTPPGYRYDLAVDDAVLEPGVVAPPAPASYLSGLAAYPYFAYFEPGAPLFPLDPFAEVTTVAAILRTHCRFEAALKWYEVSFDPLDSDSSWCFHEAPQPPIDQPQDEQNPVPVEVLALDRAPVDHAEQPVEKPRTEVPPRQRGDRPPMADMCCRQTVATRPIARRRAVILDYLETLLAWGDCLMERNAPEAFQQARLIFDTAERILGQTPRTVFRDPPDELDMTVATFAPDGPALNPRLVSLYERLTDRLGLIRTCTNARRLRNGEPRRDMPYFGDDPARDGWMTPLVGCACDPGDCCCPPSPYRFAYLIQKAGELAGEVRSLGAALLGAYEKGDAEYLGLLRAGQEHQILTLTRAIREDEWRDSDWQVQALRKTKEIAQSNRTYYATLLVNGLVPGEEDYQALTNGAVASITAATVSEAVGTVLGVIPDVFVGTSDFVQLPVGTKLANVFQGIARISNEVAQILTTTAGLRLTQAGWQRREEEWRHQVEIFDLEIEQIERQILGAERRRDVALRQLDIQQRQIDNSRDVMDLLRDKFTNEELYLWLQRETAALYYGMYELARCTARQAERAFNLERGYTSRSFVPDNAWDDLHEGLLAGERLELAVRRMEKSYLDENLREYELTKHVSLRLHSPAAFLALKLTGRCVVELPEWLFDLDYPGHYLRRIKNMSLTVPAVVGPYAGVHARLTLLSSQTRIDPRLHGPVASCCDDDVPPPVQLPRCSCRPAISPLPAQPPAPDAHTNGYVALPDDPRIVRHYAATEAIATSSGQNDSGLFELNFRDERYLPFEFAGAVSRLRLELPPENNEFDLDTVSDVILHVNYTAREGGEQLRTAASEVAQAHAPGDGRRVFDLRYEMPDEWARFVGRHGRADGGQHFDLELTRSMFPYALGDREVLVTRMELFVEAHGATPGTHREVEFAAAHDPGCELAESDEFEFQCVADGSWPGFFHGGVEAVLGPVRGNQRQRVGTFRFEDPVADVTRVFLVVDYELRRRRIQTPDGAPGGSLR
jgi:hypothetical protein